MKTVTVGAWQGDVALKAVDKLPAGMEKVDAVNGRHIVTHSETGHHHVVDATGLEFWKDPSTPFIAYLQMTEVEHADLLHLRPGVDTHETLRLKGSKVWKIFRQKEPGPEGWRAAQD